MVTDWGYRLDVSKTSHHFHAKTSCTTFAPLYGGQFTTVVPTENTSSILQFLPNLLTVPNDTENLSASENKLRLRLTCIAVYDYTF